jgi:Flp pilus assembly protein TadG
MTRSRQQPRRAGESGQAIIEFALVAPVAFMFLFGLISACLLFFQNSSLHDGASAGARIASFETSLVAQAVPGGPYCESNAPISIEQAVAKAAPGLTVNMTTLCGAQGATQLTQSTSPAGQVNITVTCIGAGGCKAPTATTVSLVVVSHGVASPLALSYTMHATSTDSLLSP